MTAVSVFCLSVGMPHPLTLGTSHAQLRCPPDTWEGSLEPSRGEGDSDSGAFASCSDVQAEAAWLNYETWGTPQVWQSQFSWQLLPSSFWTAVTLFWGSGTAQMRWRIRIADVTEAMVQPGEAVTCAKPSSWVRAVHPFGEGAVQFTGFHLHQADWWCLSGVSCAPMPAVKGRSG